MNITIIIPFYNIEYFDETLESLSVQTNKRFNVYIGNDNSPFLPDDIINKYKETLNITYKKFDNNLGSIDLTKHWSRCIDEVHTEWFMILGDDDCLAKDGIEEFCKVENNEVNKKYNVLRFHTQIVNGDSEKVSEIQHCPDYELSTTFLHRRAKNLVRSSLGEFVFKKESFLEHGIKYYPKAFYSDNLMVLLYSDFSELKNIDSVVYIRVSEKSLSGNFSNNSVIVLSGYLFYWDIILLYGYHFKKNQKIDFSKYALAGFLNKVLNTGFINFVGIILKETGILNSTELTLKIIKNKILK